MTELSESEKNNVLDNVLTQIILDENKPKTKAPDETLTDAIANTAAPIVENSLDNEGLSDAIAATDLSKGMKINEAFEIAKSRGYKGTESKSFRDGYRKNPDFGKQFGLDRVEFKDGKDRWLYFDTKA